VAVDEATVNEHKALVVLDNPLTANDGQVQQQRMVPQQSNPSPSEANYYLLLDGSNFHDRASRVHLTIRCAVPAPREKYYRHARLRLLPAPTTELSLVLEGIDLDVSVSNGLGTRLDAKDSQTHVTSNLEPTGIIELRWFRLARPKSTPRTKSTQKDPMGLGLASEAAPSAATEPAWVSSEFFQDIAIGEGRIEGNVTCVLSIFRNPIDSVTMRFPEKLQHFEILQNENIRRWRHSTVRGSVHIELKRPIEGTLTIKANYFNDTKGKSSFVGDIPELRIDGTSRETGFLAVRRRTNVSIVETKRGDGLEQISLVSVPRQFESANVKKALLVYRYFRHPATLTLRIDRHPDANVLTTIVDMAQASTLVSKAGACLTRLTLKLRSRTRDAMLFDLSPCGENARVAEIKLNGKSASLSRRDDGQCEISLSQLPPNAADTAYSLEIVIHHATTPLSGSATLALALPRVDVPVTSCKWGIYAPDDFSYFWFKGNGTFQASSGISPPIPLSRGGYRSYTVTRTLLPARAILSFSCAYVKYWLSWLPQILLFLVGTLIGHASLVVLVRGQKRMFFAQILVVLATLIVLFAGQVVPLLPFAVSGVLAYVIVLVVATAFFTGSRLAERRRRTDASPDMTAVETNVARVSSEVEGGDGSA